MGTACVVAPFAGHQELVEDGATGLVAGLAMQTKYTALVTPAVMLVYAGLYRRLRLGLAASAAKEKVPCSRISWAARRNAPSDSSVKPRASTVKPR